MKLGRLHVYGREIRKEGCRHCEVERSDYRGTNVSPSRDAVVEVGKGGIGEEPLCGNQVNLRQLVLA